MNNAKILIVFVLLFLLANLGGQPLLAAEGIQLDLRLAQGQRLRPARNQRQHEQQSQPLHALDVVVKECLK